MVHRGRGDPSAGGGDLEWSPAGVLRTPPNGLRPLKAVRFKLPDAETLNLEVTDDSASPRRTPSLTSLPGSPPVKPAAPTAPIAAVALLPADHRSPCLSRLTTPPLPEDDDVSSPQSPSSASPRIVGPPVRSLGEIKSSLRGSAINLLRQRPPSPTPAPDAAADGPPLSRIGSEVARLRGRRPESLTRVNSTLGSFRVAP